MLREISCQQLDEWIAYYQMEPFGLEPIDSLLAHFKALFINANTPKGKQRYQPDKFLMYFRRNQKELTGDELDEDVPFKGDEE